MTHAVIASCFKPSATYNAQTNRSNQLPPFLGVKFRVKTPLTLFYFLNILVFPAF